MSGYVDVNNIFVNFRIKFIIWNKIKQNFEI